MTISLLLQAIDKVSKIRYNNKRKEVLSLSRIEEIHEKGFNMSTPRSTPIEGNRIPEVDYSKMKIGIRALDDAVINLGSYKKLNPNMTKENIQRAIATGNIKAMREASEFYFKISGIYSRLCKHLANLYRYDWMITPFAEKATPEKIIDGFNKSSYYLGEFGVKEFFGEVALKVMRRGCYYGYIVRTGDTAQIQELLPEYCRVRYSVKGRPAVEFNMKFFDDEFKNVDYRLRVLKMFPKDFQKGYVAYKEGKLLPDFPGDTAGWYLLDPECTIKFNMNDQDFPPMMAVIPHIIDLDAAQELDRKKMAQRLLKIIIQKMPLDKNGELIFDVDEAQELHNNAVKMLGKAIGIDVLTTFADVEVADMSDSQAAASIDELEKVERTVYNESGTAQNLFNTDGNIALEKSILDDEANLYGLILQFESFLNYLIKPFNKNPKKLYYKVNILPTTIYNYKDMSKLYKDQSAAGGSKLLASVALGQSQQTVIATAKFENEVLDIANIFTTKQAREEHNAKMASSRPVGAPQQESNKDDNSVEKKSAGRPTKPDDQKSEKTIKNKEAMS